ncbi:hypothetical protein [Hymenobacter agri]
MPWQPRQQLGFIGPAASQAIIEKTVYTVKNSLLASFYYYVNQNEEGSKHFAINSGSPSIWAKIACRRTVASDLFRHRALG